MKNSILHLFILITFSCLFHSCGITYLRANAKIKESKGAIPPEFGAQGTVLVFIKHSDNYNKNIERIMRKKYFGEQVYIYKNELDMKEYQDKVKYRFIFDYKDRISAHSGQPNNANSANSPTKIFYVLDRKDNKEYTSNQSAANWGPLAKVWGKRLNEKRIQMQ